MRPRLAPAAGAGACARTSAPAVTRAARISAIPWRNGRAKELVTDLLSVRGDAALTRTGEHLCEDLGGLRARHAEPVVEHEERHAVGAERLRLANIGGHFRRVGVAREHALH